MGPITRSTVRTTFVFGLRLVVQAGTLLLVARMLGPDQFGAFAGVAALAVLLGTLSTFGMHLILLGEVSKDPARRRQVLSYALPFTLICGTTLLLAFLLLASLWLGTAGVSLTVLVAIGGAELLLQPLLLLCAAEHHGLRRIARSQLLMVLPLTLRLVVAVAVFLSPVADKLLLYGYGYFVASSLALGFALTTIPARWPDVRNFRLPSGGELREAMGFAALNITAAGPAELDKTLATKLLSLGAAGLYAAGARIIGAAILPVNAMTTAALPRLFKEGASQPRRTGRLLRLMLGAAACYGLALAAALWWIAPTFDWVLGDQYQGTSHVIRWLCLALPAIAIRRVAGTVLMAVGRPWMRVGFEASGLLVLAIGASILVTQLGALGMPLALVCAEWTMAILGTALLASRVSLRQRPASRAPESGRVQ